MGKAQRKDDRDKVRRRGCLKCQRKFRSINAGNRICPKCDSRNASVGGLRVVPCDGLGALRDDIAAGAFND